MSNYTYPNLCVLMKEHKDCTHFITAVCTVTAKDYTNARHNYCFNTIIIAVFAWDKHFSMIRAASQANYMWAGRARPGWRRRCFVQADNAPEWSSSCVHTGPVTCRSCSRCHDRRNTRSRFCMLSTRRGACLHTERCYFQMSDVYVDVCVISRGRWRGDAAFAHGVFILVRQPSVITLLHSQQLSQCLCDFIFKEH